jgi:hypothetical protein
MALRAQKCAQRMMIIYASDYLSARAVMARPRERTKGANHFILLTAWELYQTTQIRSPRRRVQNSTILLAESGRRFFSRALPGPNQGGVAQPGARWGLRFSLRMIRGGAAEIWVPAFFGVRGKCVGGDQILSFFLDPASFSTPFHTRPA